MTAELGGEGLDLEIRVKLHRNQLALVLERSVRSDVLNRSRDAEFERLFEYERLRDLEVKIKLDSDHDSSPEHEDSLFGAER